MIGQIIRKKITKSGEFWLDGAGGDGGKTPLDGVALAL
jgi:hypothetical protein